MTTNMYLKNCLMMVFNQLVERAFYIWDRHPVFVAYLTCHFDCRVRELEVYEVLFAFKQRSFKRGCSRRGKLAYDFSLVIPAAVDALVAYSNSNRKVFVVLWNEYQLVGKFVVGSA